MGCEPLCPQALVLLWDHLAPFPAFVVLFWNAEEMVQKRAAHPPVHSDCARNDTYRKAPFEFETPCRNVFILSFNILALIFLNWHTRPLPSHTLYFAKPFHRTTTTLLAFCFPTCRYSFACRHFVQGILFGCTDYMPSPITKAVSGHFVS